MFSPEEKAEQKLRQAMACNSAYYQSFDCLVWVGAKCEFGHTLYGKYRSITPDELLGRDYRVGMMGGKPSVIFNDAYFDIRTRKFIRKGETNVRSGKV